SGRRTSSRRCRPTSRSARPRSAIPSEPSALVTAGRPLRHHRGMRLLHGLVMVATLALASGCNIGNSAGGCTAGAPCVCDGIGNCERSCPEGGCEFICRGIGNCILSCEGGGCSMACSGTGNCTLDCPGGDCTANCSGLTGNCICTG